MEIDPDRKRNEGKEDGQKEERKKKKKKILRIAMLKIL